MKKFLAVLLLAISTPALAEPTLAERYLSCSQYAIKGTEYSVYAHQNPTSLDALEAIVKADIGKGDNPARTKALIWVGGIAWKFRAERPDEVGATIYADCVKHIGTST